MTVEVGKESEPALGKNGRPGRTDPDPAGLGKKLGDGKSVRPVLLLTLVLAITWAGLLWFGWQSIQAYRYIEIKEKEHLRLIELRGDIIHLDEVLTMSARMAATTGDLRWEERYRRFKPKLDGAIDETLKIASGLGIAGPAEITKAANIALVEMENRAFDLVRQGRNREAEDLLFGEGYEAQKRIYAEGMAHLYEGLNRVLNAGIGRERRGARVGLIASALFLPFLMAGWLVVLRALNRSRESLLESHRLLEGSQSVGLVGSWRMEIVENRLTWCCST